MIGRNQPRPNVPDAVTLQWANGKSNARDAGSTIRFTSFIGFYLEFGKDPALDEVLTAARSPQVEIKHQRREGHEIVRHWSLGETLDLLPITSGPVASTVAASLANGAAAETAAAGIGIRWGRGEGERSKLAVRGFVQSLWATGYRRPVQVATRSRMTDHLFAALLDHTRAAVAADAAVNRSLHPGPVSPAELWLPLGPGAETEFGSRTTATVTPLVSRHPEDLTIEYLRSRWRPADVWDATTAAWAGVQAWAKEFPITGDDGLSSDTSAEDAAPEPTIRGRR